MEELFREVWFRRGGSVVPGSVGKMCENDSAGPAIFEGVGHLAGMGEGEGCVSRCGVVTSWDREQEGIRARRRSFGRGRRVAAPERIVYKRSLHLQLPIFSPCHNKSGMEELDIPETVIALYTAPRTSTSASSFVHVFPHFSPPRTFIKLKGRAVNLDIRFSTRNLQLEDTYIALLSQATVDIINNSDVPIDFSWRAFPNMDEEIQQKLKLGIQLQEEKTEELLFLEHMTLEDDEDEDEGTEELSEDEALIGGKKVSISSTR